MKFNQYIFTVIVALSAFSTAMSMEKPSKESDKSLAQILFESSINKCIDQTLTIEEATKKVKDLLNTNEFTQLMADNAEFNQQLIAQLRQKFGDVSESILALKLGTNGAILFLGKKIKHLSAHEQNETMKEIKTLLSLAIYAVNKTRMSHLIDIINTTDPNYVPRLIQHFSSHFLQGARIYDDPAAMLPLTLARVDLMIGLGAELNEPNQQTTPLQWAIASKFPELVKLLLENGADVKVTSRDGLTPLEYAKRLNVYNGDMPIEIFRLLQDNQKKKLI